MPGAVSRFSFVPGGGASSMAKPRVNRTDDPYLTGLSGHANNNATQKSFGTLVIRAPRLYRHGRG